MHTDIINSLNILNFYDLIKIKHPNIENYSFYEYEQNKYNHLDIEGFCTSCEDNGFSISPKNPDFKLRNISHGTHSTDILSSLSDPPDITDWNHDPVMFIFESPSIDPGFYKSICYKEFSKSPTTKWYWIHGGKKENISYPKNFKGKQYGGFLLSCIETFQLSNAYITNFVKCGLNNQNGKKFLGINGFDKRCIENCYHKFLQKEIDIIKPKAIFAIGSNVEKRLKTFTKNKYFIQGIPHPARQRSGFKNEYYKVLYFWLILRALLEKNIIKSNQIHSFTEMFIKKYSQKS